MPKVVPGYREQAQKRILDAASREFAEKGYRNTTMDDIARRIGVSKGAVYQYFKSKEALVGAIGRHYLEKAFQAERLPPKGHNLIRVTEESFAKLLDSIPEWYPSLICDVMSEAQRDGYARDLVREIRGRLVEGMSTLWLNRQVAGEVPKDMDAGCVARGLTGLQLGLLIQISTGLPREEAIEAWTGVVRAMANGMAHKK